MSNNHMLACRLWGTWEQRVYWKYLSHTSLYDNVYAGQVLEAVRRPTQRPAFALALLLHNSRLHAGKHFRHIYLDHTTFCCSKNIFVCMHSFLSLRRQGSLNRLTFLRLALHLGLYPVQFFHGGLRRPALLLGSTLRNSIVTYFTSWDGVVSMSILVRILDVIPSILLHVAAVNDFTFSLHITVCYFSYCAMSIC